jgi:hypothetical protein
MHTEKKSKVFAFQLHQFRRGLLIHLFSVLFHELAVHLDLQKQQGENQEERNLECELLLDSMFS